MSTVRIDQVDFAKMGGLVPVVAKDYSSGKVLMLAYANVEAVEETVKTGFAHYFSRSRGKLWRKGEESGHVQRVREILVDCDNDSLLYLVEQVGPACHTGEESCFYRPLEGYGGREFDGMMAERIVALLRGASITKRRWVKDKSRRDYPYLVNPITEGIPASDPEVLAWLVKVIDRVAPEEIDKIVTFEALGIPYASLLSQLRKKPLATIRKRDFHTPEQLLARVAYSSGFERGDYYIYGISKGDRILLLDDMVSTGGSLVPTIKAILASGVKLGAVVCVVEKPQYGGSELVERLTGVRVRTLFKMYLKRGRVDAEPAPLLLDMIGR